MRGTLPLHAGDRVRYTVGVNLSSQAKTISAAAVRAEGRGYETLLRVEAYAESDVPDAVAGAIRGLRLGNAVPPATVARLRTGLVAVQVEVISEVVHQAGLSPDYVLALGVLDPGVWHLEGSNATAYTGLCDAAGLAAATGMNVIDAFPARDLAQQGLGGPVKPLAEWLLLRDRQQTRALIDLGRTTRLSFLPAGMEAASAGRVLSFDVGPGTGLLDLLVGKLTNDAQRYDSGGRLAVQGAQIPELFEHWLNDSYFEKPLPRWQPFGVRPERFLNESIRMAMEADWAMQDVLCTASHFIAEAVARAIKRRLPKLPRVGEVIISGGGQQNGMLLRALHARLTDLAAVRRIAEFNMPGEAVDAACAGGLALLHIDQLPAVHTGITGASVPRVLGQLTPGSPLRWNRLLRHMAQSQPPTMSLRSAV